MSKIIKSSQAAPRGVAAYERGVLGTQTTDAPGVEPGEWVETDPAAQAEADAEKRLQELYAEGLRRGLEAGKADFEKASTQAVSALRVAAEHIQQAHEEFLLSLEPQVLKLTEAMVLRILEREARLDPQVAANTIRAALRHLSDRERLTIYLNPDDLETLRARGIDPFEGIEGLEGVELAADPSVGPGGCMASTDSVQVDARLDKQLEKILEALTERSG